MLGLGSEENASLYSTGSGLPSDHADYAALEVAIEYLTGLEGDFWRKIRGLGLAYSYSIRNSPEQKLMSFTLSRSTDPVRARAAACKIVEDYASGATSLDRAVFDGSIASLAYANIQARGTKSAAQSGQLGHALAGKPCDYDDAQLRAILAVTPDAALEALRRHLVPLMRAETSCVAIVTPLNKAAEVARGLPGAKVTTLRESRLDQFFGDAPGTRTAAPALAKKGALLALAAGVTAASPAVVVARRCRNK